jgi:uncharacterized protein YqgV (UPF0045/DUF77 family)
MQAGTKCRPSGQPNNNVKEVIKMEELISIIGNVGFPMAVAAYLLIRIEGRLQSLSEAISDLREAIITLPRDALLSRSLPSTVREQAELSNNTVQ